MSDSYIYEVEQLQAKSRLRDEQKDAEIERLRDEIAEHDGILAVWRRRCTDADTEIERLRHELADAHGVAQACEIRAEKAQAEIERLRVYVSGVRCPHCDELRLELGYARGEIERLRLQVKMLPLPEYRDDPRLHEVIEEQRTEIERLRDFIKRDWPYSAGPLEVVAERDAEIERLRELADRREKQLDTHIAALIKAEAEIKRLRALLREFLAEHDSVKVHKRVREALGQAATNVI